MSLGTDIVYQLSLVEQQPDDTVESLAERLFFVQMEVLSANVGGDIISSEVRLCSLPADIQEGWIQRAKKMFQENVSGN